MFLSMTGFGRAASAFPWGTVTMEIASVNHRYQEIGVRLPKEMSSFENSVVLTLRSALKRGKVRLSAEINWTDEYKTAKVDAEALRSYYLQLRKIAEELKAPFATDLTSLLLLPGVCDSPRMFDEFDKFEEGGKDKEESLKKLTMAAVDALMEMKKSEGAKLQAVVERDMDDFERLVRSLSERWGKASSEALDGLRARIEKVMERFDLEIDQNRVAQEISFLADKWDVSEELARLAGHISKFREIMASENSDGRKLDFLIQEMNREVNTMGSKVGDAEFRWTVVEAKSCLERVREQIQNVE
jgi:uncharacterized protein (TIGR00255 family)